MVPEAFGAENRSPMQTAGMRFLEGVQGAPSHQLAGLGERCKLPSEVLVQIPGCKRILGIEEPRKRLNFEKAKRYSCPRYFN